MNIQAVMYWSGALNILADSITENDAEGIVRLIAGSNGNSESFSQDISEILHDFNAEKTGKMLAVHYGYHALKPDKIFLSPQKEHIVAVTSMQFPEYLQKLNNPNFAFIITHIEKRSLQRWIKAYQFDTILFDPKTEKEFRTMAPEYKGRLIPFQDIMCKKPEPQKMSAEAERVL